MTERNWVRWIAMLGVLATTMQADAAPESVRGDIKELRLGLIAEEMPYIGYFGFACGSNGGPPARPLDGWEDFKQCNPEETGLREVYVEFDDEMETMALALAGDVAEFGAKYSGTKVAGHYVILSVLFDEAGVVDGLRVVTDPRVDVEERRLSYLFRIRAMGRYGRQGWDCVDRPPEEGYSDVGGLYIDQRCIKVYRDNRRLVLETHLFRKPGQTGLDEQGQWRPGDFESSTRLEIYVLDVALP